MRQGSEPPAGRCRAVVVTCIDYRFVEPLRRLLADEGLTGTADLIAWPGGAAAIPADEAVVEQALATASSLHDPEEMILVVHRDCGRLGGSGAFPGPDAEVAALENHLTEAYRAVTRRFPAVRVRLFRFDARGAVPVALPA